jgi:hypothetical protein
LRFAEVAGRWGRDHVTDALVRPFASLHLQGSRQNPTTAGQRAIVGVDVEGSTNLTDSEKRNLREQLYRQLDFSLLRSHLMLLSDPLLDRGDGAMILLRASTQVVLSSFVPELLQFLASHNARHLAGGFRLRVAVHVGHVRYDQHGPYGEAVDLTFRLLESSELKSRLKRTTAPFVLAVTDEVRRTIAAGHGEHDQPSFSSLTWLRFNNSWHETWVYMPE